MIPKFRVYFEQYKRMIYSIGIVNQNMILVDFHDTGDTESLFITDRIHVMQSTGLFDKNSVEIFDGDVVNFMVPNQMISGTYQIRQAKSGEWRLDNRVQGRPLYISGSYHCEVVGNVWEDGDLLESVEE
ncbi:UNVERIFIED_CONTAM: hypothetical protein KB581_09045 [Streptococcus canis]